MRAPHALGAALVAGVVLTGIGLAARQDRPPAAAASPPGLAARGLELLPSSIARDDLRELESVAGPARVYRLRAAGGVAFYRIEAKRGECFAVGGAGSPATFAAVECPTGYPSTGQLLLDESFYRLGRDVRIFGLAGFAADGVASVAVIAEDGRAFRAPVRSNTYFLAAGELPTGPVRELVAYGESGEVLETIELRRS